MLTELSAQLHVPFAVLLDGDKQDQYRDNPNVCFLPVADLEELFLQDPQAVREGFLAALISFLMFTCTDTCTACLRKGRLLVWCLSRMTLERGWSGCSPMPAAES